MNNMLFLILTVTIYLFITGYLGYRGFRGTKTATDYLLAGRKAHPFVMAMSYGATFISTSAIVGFGGAAAVFGMGLLWLTFLNIFVGIFIAFVFFGGRTRAMGHRLDAHTFPELLGRRYKSRFLQVFSGGVILVFMPLYAGVVLMGAAKAIEVRTDAPYGAALFFFAAIVALYVIMGGLKGVMYTDAFQGALMFVTMLIIVALTYGKLGGITEAHQRLTDLPVQAWERWAAAGHQGWTSMPAFGSPFWWTLVSTIVMGVGIGVLAQPQLVVRFMTVRSTRELNRAVLTGGIFIIMMTGVAFTVGALSNVLFFDAQNEVAVVAAKGVTDEVIPLFMKAFMPGWLGDIFVVALIAAAMSTVSGQFHAMGTAAGRDVYETLTGTKAGDRRSMVATQAGIFVTFVVSVLLAYTLPVMFKEFGVAIIARGTAIFFGLCCSTFLPMYLGGLYTRVITRKGAVAGAITGFTVSAFWLLFIHIAESKALGVSQALFGRASLVEGVRTGFIFWQEVDPLFVAFPLAAIVTVLVSLVTPKLDPVHLDHCFGTGKVTGTSR